MKIFLICFILGSIALSANAADNFIDYFGGYESKINKMINQQINTELVGHYTYLHLSHLFNDKSRYYPQVAKYFKAKSDEEMSHAERFMEYQNQRGARIEMSKVNIQGQFGDSKNLRECNNVQKLKEAFACAVALEAFVTDSLTELAREASDVKPIDNTLAADDVNDLMTSQAIVVEYSKSDAKAKKSLAQTMVALNNRSFQRGFRVVTVEYVQLAEMITHEFLGHQMEDTKELANYLQTLTKFQGEDQAVENLGNYLFDKKLEL